MTNTYIDLRRQSMELRWQDIRDYMRIAESQERGEDGIPALQRIRSLITDMERLHNEIAQEEHRLFEEEAEVRRTRGRDQAKMVLERLMGDYFGLPCNASHHMLPY